jgi:hypothetical protein
MLDVLAKLAYEFGEQRLEACILGVGAFKIFHDALGFREAVEFAIGKFVAARQGLTRRRVQRLLFGDDVPDKLADKMIDQLASGLARGIVLFEFLEQGLDIAMICDDYVDQVRLLHL